jgi:hypothetical protein
MQRKKRKKLQKIIPVHRPINILTTAKTQERTYITIEEPDGPASQFLGVGIMTLGVGIGPIVLHAFCRQGSCWFVLFASVPASLAGGLGERMEEALLDR